MINISKKCLYNGSWFPKHVYSYGNCHPTLLMVSHRTKVPSCWVTFWLITTWFGFKPLQPPKTRENLYSLFLKKFSDELSYFTSMKFPFSLAFMNKFFWSVLGSHQWKCDKWQNCGVTSLENSRHECALIHGCSKVHLDLKLLGETNYE